MSGRLAGQMMDCQVDSGGLCMNLRQGQGRMAVRYQARQAAETVRRADDLWLWLQDGLSVVRLYATGLQAEPIDSALYGPLWRREQTDTATGSTPVKARVLDTRW